MQKSAGRRSAWRPAVHLSGKVTTKRSPLARAAWTHRFGSPWFSTDGRAACKLRRSLRHPRPRTPAGRGFGEGKNNGNHAQVLAERRSRRSHGRGDKRLCRCRGRYDQGRHPAFAVGHDGDQRDDPEGSDADADRRAQCQGRPARQEDRAGGGRSGLELAAVRREGARADQQGQGRGGVRLLDLGVAQIGAAGVRRTQRPALLSAGI